jgi:ADP-heptose:LPS heptosyltransferase
MTLAKRLEALNKRFWYAILRVILRNRPVAAPLDPEQIRKILIFRYDAIGDMVVTLPSVDIIRKNHPAAEIAMVVSPQNIAIIKNDSRVGRRHIYRKGLGELIRLVRQTRRERYDAIYCFVLHKTTKAGLLANLIGGRRAVKVTLLNPDRAHLYDIFFNLQMPIARATDVMGVLQAKVVSASFGWPYEPEMVRYRLVLSEENHAVARRFHEEIGGGRFIILNISSGNWYRRWSTGKNIELIEKIAALEPDLSIVIVSSPGDAAEAMELGGSIPGRTCTFPATPDILDVAALLELADLVISPDTSIVHIASAMGTPVLGLYSGMATFIPEWMPHRVPYRAVETADRTPLETIPVEAVVAAYLDLRKDF